MGPRILFAFHFLPFPIPILRQVIFSSNRLKKDSDLSIHTLNTSSIGVLGVSWSHLFLSARISEIFKLIPLWEPGNHGLSNCPPKIHMLKLTPQCHIIKRWNL